MKGIVIEHVPVADLPPAWRAKLVSLGESLVTVRIEWEGQATGAQVGVPAEDPLFGMWLDREDMTDVPGYIRNIRAARFAEGRGNREPGGDAATDTEHSDE